MHGNTGSRAREHRLNIYHIFQELDYHTIAFDYRGNVFLTLFNYMAWCLGTYIITSMCVT